MEQAELEHCTRQLISRAHRARQNGKKQIGLILLLLALAAPSLVHFFLVSVPYLRGFVGGRLILSVLSACYIVGTYHTVRLIQGCAQNFEHARLIDHFLRTADAKKLIAFYERHQAQEGPSRRC